MSNKPTTEKAQTVFIVDDDRSIREAMGFLMDSVDLNYQLFDSANKFFDTLDKSAQGCLVLDIRMPGLSGLELQQKLIAAQIDLPIIFITGHADVPMAVEAMRHGAIDFIQKPFREQQLLDRIQLALKESEQLLATKQRAVEIRDLAESLTSREHEVFDLVALGKPNKIMAFELGVSQRTVEIYRANVMQKMQADSLADLVRMHMVIDQTPPAQADR